MADKELLCKVYFNYSCEHVPSFIKTIAEHWFMIGRDSIVQLLNPHYEQWNADYGKEVTGEDDAEYNAYIQNKQQEIIDDFNESSDNPLTFYADEWADIAAKFKLKTTIIHMHMSLKLIN